MRSDKDQPRLDWSEGRRRRAWELKQQGWIQTGIAAALGVTPGAVSQWLKRARREGVEALRRHPAPGPAPRLTAEQLAQVPILLARGPQAYDFCGQRWTCKRVAEALRRTFGVAYHPAHVNRLLHALRHSIQRPVERTAQRGEAAIAAWWQDRWPALKKKRPTQDGPLFGRFSPGGPSSSSAWSPIASTFGIGGCSNTCRTCCPYKCAQCSLSPSARTT
jgi:transposase